MYYFVHYINIPIINVFDGFPKISEKSPKTVRRPHKFRKTTEDNRRLLKSFKEDPKMFQSYNNKYNYSLMAKHDIRGVLSSKTHRKSTILRIEDLISELEVFKYKSVIFVVNNCYHALFSLQCMRYFGMEGLMNQGCNGPFLDCNWMLNQ